jgi:hypothetical protein
MTAAYAIRQKMHVDSLEDITLSELWELTFEVDSAERTLELTKMLVDRSIIFVNHNKQNFQVRLKGDSPPHSEESGDRTVFVVSFSRSRADNPVLADRVRRRFGVDELKQVKHGRLWILKFGFADADRRLEFAREIARTESRKQGLLVNPHAEEFRVLEGELPVGVIQ